MHIRRMCRVPSFVFVLGFTLSAGEYFIVKDGEPMARIYLPSVFGRATLLAAQELSNYIEKMTGARIPIDFGKPILLELDLDGNRDGFTIEQRRNMLRIDGDSGHAVLFGVYQYLSELGVRWFMPGELGENVPRLASIKIGNQKKTIQTLVQNACDRLLGLQSASLQLESSGTPAPRVRPLAAEKQMQLRPLNTLGSNT